MTVVKYGSEAWALRKADENLLDVFQGNCLRIILGTRLTDRISNSRLYEKCGSIPLSRAIMKERLSWLGQVLRMKDDRLPKIVLFGQPSGATRKEGRPCLGWEDVINKDLKEMGTSWEGVNEGGLETIRLEEECSSLCWPQAAWCCSELFVVVVVMEHISQRPALLVAVLIHYIQKYGCS